MRYKFVTFVPKGDVFSAGFYFVNRSDHDTHVYLRFDLNDGRKKDMWVPLKPWGHAHINKMDLDIRSINTHFSLLIEMPDDVFGRVVESTYFIAGDQLATNSNTLIMEDCSDWSLKKWLGITKNDNQYRKPLSSMECPAWYSTTQAELNSLDEDVRKVWEFIMRRMYFEFPEAADRQTHVLDLSLHRLATKESVKAANPRISKPHLDSHGDGRGNHVDLGYFTTITNATQCNQNYAESRSVKPVSGDPIVYTNMWNLNPTDYYERIKDDYTQGPKYFDSERNARLIELLNLYLPSARIVIEQRITDHLIEDGYDISGTVALTIEYPSKRSDHHLHYHVISDENTGRGDRVALDQRIGD